MMTAGLRKLTFATHIAASLGWAGAVLVFLALAAIGMTSDHEVVVRGAYLLMAPAAWFVLVPLAHASLITGIVLSLATTWGLFQHYWVVSKLALTAFATAILMVYMGTFRQMAGVAADLMVDIAAVRNASPLIHSVLAFVVLMAATVLGVYKPCRMTVYGKRKRQDRRHGASELAAPGERTPAAEPGVNSLYIFRAIILAIVVALCCCTCRVLDFATRETAELDDRGVLPCRNGSHRACVIL